MAVNHPLIHLSLLIAQPVCFAYFGGESCTLLWTAWNATFIITHGICFASFMIGSLLGRLKYEEWSRLFHMLGVPVYYYFIYVAHFHNLNALTIKH